MMRSIFLIFILIFIAGCDGYTTVEGNIVDGDGQPIEGAQVQMSLSGTEIGIESTSDAEGWFEAGGCHAPTHQPLNLVVHKKGFKTDRRHLPTNETNNKLRIVMERDALPVEGKEQ